MLSGHVIDLSKIVAVSDHKSFTGKQGSGYNYAYGFEVFFEGTENGLLIFKVFDTDANIQTVSGWYKDLIKKWEDFKYYRI